MATSTSLVVASGALSIADVILNDSDTTNSLLRISVATVLASLASAGLDRVVPGLGTGIAVVLLTGVLLTSGPRIVAKINKS